MEDSLELQQQIVRLQALFEASRRIHSTIQMDEVLRCALEITVRELEMEGAFYTAFPFSKGRIPPRFLVNPQSGNLAPGCTAFPLLDKAGDKISDLVVISRDGAQLTLEESDFLESLAIQTAVAIENARHHEQALRLQRVEYDLASARAIQRSLIPQNIQNAPGYQIALRSFSCYEVGGDYLDVMALESGEQVMIVADVAGKGLASAMVGSSFRSAFRAMVTTGLPLVQIAVRLNTLHFNEGLEARRRYVTALLLRLDPKNHRLECVNAGHNPAFLWTGITKKRVLLEASSTPIGMLPFTEYRSEVHELHEGARLLAYTDGLTEVVHGDEEFGTDRLAETFRTCTGRDGEAILDHIWQTIQNFNTESEPADDMTALVLLRR